MIARLSSFSDPILRYVALPLLALLVVVWAGLHLYTRVTGRPGPRIPGMKR